MKNIIIIVFVTFLFTVGCSEVETYYNNSPADGNVTQAESEVMQQEWCDYNKGRDFAKGKC